MNAQNYSVLIVLTGSIGDVTRALCLVSELKRSIPKCRISWLVEPKCLDLVKMNPAVDRVYIFERNRGIRAVLKTISELRADKFDLLLDLQRHLKSGVFSFFSGAKRRVGFHRSNAKEFNWLFSTETIAAFDEEQSKLKHYLKFVEHLGFKVPEQLDFGLKLPPSKPLISGEYIGAIIGSSWHTKDWPLEGYRGVFRLMLKEGQPRIVLLGDRTKIEAAAKLEAEFPALVNFVGKTTLSELLRIIKGAKLCFGPDSGPAHLAGALGVKYLTLFGPTSPSRVSPYGSEEFYLQSKVGCSPCYRRSCPGLGKICMKLISPEMVKLKVAAQLGRGMSA